MREMREWEDNGEGTELELHDCVGDGYDEVDDEIGGGGGGGGGWDVNWVTVASEHKIHRQYEKEEKAVRGRKRAIKKKRGSKNSNQ